MENTTIQEQLKIVKYTESSPSGIKRISLPCCAVGYIVRGTKKLYYSDKCSRISGGEIFYMSAGMHNIENVADDDNQFEQIVFYYTPSELQHIVSHLNIIYSMKISNGHSCDNCSPQKMHISAPATTVYDSFFRNCESYISIGLFSSDIAQKIKMTELIYLLVSGDDCCMKNKLLGNMDVVRDNFERIVYANMFNDVSIEQLANASNRSITSFKKEFKRRFSIPPHKWYIHQRLAQSQLLLIFTSKSVSEIGIECSFPNTSHFIKLFKKAYNMTPASFRQQHFAGSDEDGTVTQVDTVQGAAV